MSAGLVPLQVKASVRLVGVHDASTISTGTMHGKDRPAVATPDSDLHGPATILDRAEIFESGGQRSLRILDQLRDERAASFIGLRAGRSISDLWWLPAQSYAIEQDPTRTVWHAGHVSALLSDDHFVIAGTQTGGVWLLSPSVQPSFR